MRTHPDNKRLYWVAIEGEAEDGNKEYIAYVQELLNQRHINVDVQDDDGNTPLHFAVALEHPIMIRMLLDNKANIFIKNKKGNTPMEFAEKLSEVMLLKK